MKNNFFLAFFYLVGIAFPTPMMSQISPQDYQDACVFDYSISLPDFREGMARVEKNEKLGYIDKQGHEIIPFIYEYGHDFSEGMASVRKNGKWGFIDKQGREIIPFNFEGASSFSEGMARVKKNGKWGYIDKQGHEITPCIYMDGSDFSEGMALVNVVKEDIIMGLFGIQEVSAEQYGYIDKQGREIIPCKFTEAYSFSEGMACVNNVLGWYYIDKQGNEIIPSVFEDASSFSEGMALVEKDGKWGYIDKQGREIIPFIYENGYDFREGIALVNKNGKWGHIDKQGNEITPFIFDNASSFSEGMASVKSNGKWGFIDKQGREIIPFIYENGRDFREGIALVNKNGKWGYIDKQGHEITPFIFDNASSFSEGMARVEINETIGFINKNGEPITINFSGKTCYENGVYEENRISQNDSEEVKYNKYKKALSWFMKGAEKNNPECCFKVGYYKYSGLFVEKNYAEAVKWLETSNQLYEKSNELKDTNGNTFRFLGYCYSEGGYGIIKDDSKAFSYFMEGAKYNNEGCFYALAISYLNGLGCDIDNEQACHYADELYNIKKEDYSSIYGTCYNGLAYYYANKKDFSKALSSIEKAIDANPMVGNLYDSKGEIFLMMGKEDEALKLWNKVMELDKDNLKFYEENSELYKQLKAKGKITSSSSSSSSTNKPSTPSTTNKPSTPSTTSSYTPSKQTFTVNGVSFTMVRVEGGTFTMGATSEQGSDASDNEKPTHQVTLSTYSIGETEVTQELWEAVMGKNPSKFKGAKHPVEQLSWNDCQRFIKKLNEKTGKTFRLPTEAEWEYASRGGNQSKGYKYSGSNELCDVGCCFYNSDASTFDVRTKQPNELGLYDMSGNVYEWCSDWYGKDYYASSPLTNPKGPEIGSRRVCRGGCWAAFEMSCRSSCRDSYEPDFKGHFGLRLVLSESYTNKPDNKTDKKDNNELDYRDGFWATL